MWQTIVTIIVLIGAVAYTVRHFLRVYRAGNDSVCSGCSSAGHCKAKSGKNLACGGEHSLFPESDDKINGCKP